MFESMAGLHGPRDELTRYTAPLTGAYYFFPAAAAIRRHGSAGSREVAHHELTTPGRPSICDGHYPPKPAGALERKPRARNDEERESLALRSGAEAWFINAAAAGA
jgi:hypothetical protein